MCGGLLITPCPGVFLLCLPPCVSTFLKCVQRLGSDQLKMRQAHGMWCVETWWCSSYDELMLLFDLELCEATLVERV